MWLDKVGTVLADTVYKNGVLVAKDVTIEMPSVNFLTADFRAMGTMTMPVPGQIEAMEATVTKIGTDLGLRDMVMLESETLEYRWAQDVKTNDGTSKVVGCKAFLRSVPKGIPGISIDPGNISESSIAYAVSRYQLFVDGEEYWLVDQLNDILRIGGKDYRKDINSLL